MSSVPPPAVGAHGLCALICQGDSQTTPTILPAPSSPSPPPTHKKARSPRAVSCSPWRVSRSARLPHSKAVRAACPQARSRRRRTARASPVGTWHVADLDAVGRRPRRSRTMSSDKKSRHTQPARHAPTVIRNTAQRKSLRLDNHPARASRILSVAAKKVVIPGLPPAMPGTPAVAALFVYHPDRLQEACPDAGRGSRGAMVGAG